MTRTWWKDLIALAFAGFITIMALAVVMEGNGITQVAGVVATGILSILLIFGVDVEYIKLGKFELKMRDRKKHTKIEVERERDPWE